MLASIAPATNDFHALARYLVHGKPGTTPHPERVAWILPHNIPTDDPERAARIMQATAGLSARTRKAAYHLMIAWHEKERPTPEQMQDIAFKTLAMAGLGEHQALIMGHDDRPHRHLHMLINRVHPETGKAWHQAHDYARFDAIMRELSETHGFLYAPAHAYNPEQTKHRRKKPNSRATYAAKRGAPTNRPQWSRDEAEVYGARVSDGIDAGSSWEDLEDLFARDGYALEPKASGWIVGNANGYTKLSALRLQRSAKSMSRFPAAAIASLFKPTPERRHIPLVDAVDIAKGLAAWGLISKDDVRTAISETIEGRQERRRLKESAAMLDKLIKTHLLASTSMTAPRPSPSPDPANKRPAATRRQRHPSRATHRLRIALSPPPDFTPFSATSSTSYRLKSHKIDR
ncbi:relaxase/mobilization nuclease domain-containing protein [Hyphomicrobium sp. CS1BSMeth3]|uniref:relaxase/mobilization nuclease domain-containing protein n=1 Tax=Hyphomicrobium sp. CS1BSMeth3 TaxID=1892844 RepID=UPI0009316ED0|nr:relaxase/mobilization nuclease domain-containing protein [Hyphomicrobium sp. CS1BSMeth3]